MSARETTALQPVRQEAAPLRRKIIAAIREGIETGVLKAGERLVETDLARDLKVSRPSLREALRELEAEGLVANTSARGLVVVRITREEAENIYRVRGALEALIAEQFAEKATPEALEALTAAAEELDAAYLSRRIELILAAKRAFYDQFCTGAGNPVVLDILRRLNSRISRLRATSLSSPDRLHPSMEEIRSLVDALRSRDAAAARAAALRHVSNAAAAALSAGEEGGADAAITRRNPDDE